MMDAYSVPFPMESGRSLVVAVVALAVVMSGQRAEAQTSTAGLGGPGWVLSQQKISDTEGGFTGTLDDDDRFSRSLASLGDLDGDGVGDLAVGVRFDDDGGVSRGTVWILFLNDDGTVNSYQKISSTEGGFTGPLDNGDYFGSSVASLGDLDGDGVADLAVGAMGDDDGGPNRGAVWMLFLNSNGTVRSHQKISDTEGRFTGTLDNQDSVGVSLASLGDLDGDGVGDLGVGAFFDNDGGGDRGAVWVLFLNPDGTVKAHQKISDTQGGFTGALDNDDRFGSSVASLGDLDGDRVTDLAVGAVNDDDGGNSHGAVWVLFLNPDGTVKSHQKISSTQGGFTGMLDLGDLFGYSVAALGDLDGDGVGDLAVGATGDDDGGGAHGAVWILFLNNDGTVNSYQKISSTEGGFAGILDDRDVFGWSVAALGDLDGDGVGDLAVGAPNDDDGGDARGAVWVLFLNGDGTVKAHQKFSDTQGGFTGILDNGDVFGWSVASLGDLDGDGTGDLAVGALSDDDGGEARGAVWVLFLNPDSTVKSHQKISNTQGGFTGTLDDFDHFGVSVASLSDLDGDGVGELAVGAFLDDGPGVDRGAVRVMFLNGDGTVKSHEKISHTQGGFTGTLDNYDRFGISVASLGDLDGDRVGDLAVGAHLDDDGGANRGAVWMLFLDGVPQTPCPWDIDGSNDVGVKDLLILLGAWGPNPGHPADFDDSGDVGVKDLLVLLGNWGACP